MVILLQTAKKDATPDSKESSDKWTAEVKPE